MCRPKSEGGRRCPGSHSGGSAAGHAGDIARAAHHHCYCAGSHKPDCPNYGASDAMPPLADGGGEEESYQGTPWQGYDEANQRADEIRRRVYGGETVEDIMSESIMRRAQDRIAQITQEGW